ncbi:type II secretion system protein GspM [Stakelama tenebrarum]|uniref:Type II secretion system protein M n=1 Tax=Stakelama tenebrarum TaxID=2711215 RepID=A0A6G6Y485_9SPHN|nr:type II secretion system protein GspM [Sphingosinithalassobacter tenebrarum]QIG79742.1 type II secretion system protein M [Sphingosinithalassobacter tenebrarum]
MSRFRSPAFDNALARAADWWNGLSSRERWMVGGLGVFLGLLILIYGVVKPLQAARADALQDIRTYETLNARIRAAGALSAAPPPEMRSGTPVDILNAAAQARGIDAVVIATPEGARAEIARGGYDAILGWIADISTSSSLKLTRADIRRGTAPGQVSATVDFAQ